MDAGLQVGAVAESVVSAALGNLDRTSAEVGGLIEPEQMASLMMLAPDAVNYSDGSQRNIRFNGHSIDDGNYTFDGIDDNGVQEQTEAETRLNIAFDSIADFRVSTAVYTAESGAAGLVQVQVVFKAGTNQFHGCTFYSPRNHALDARSPFDAPLSSRSPCIHSAPTSGRRIRAAAVRAACSTRTCARTGRTRTRPWDQCCPICTNASAALAISAGTRLACVPDLDSCLQGVIETVSCDE